MADKAGSASIKGSAFDVLANNRMVDWCDGTMTGQIDDPDHPAVHGALASAVCSHILGRCLNAVYRILH